jgi:hypothetical protein
MADAQEETLLYRVHRLEQELEQLKRALLQQLAVQPAHPTGKPSLFGCVRGGDVTEAGIEEAQRGLFRNLDDL